MGEFMKRVTSNGHMLDDVEKVAGRRQSVVTTAVAAVIPLPPVAVSPKTKRRDIDYGWAWVTFGAAFLAQMLTTGHTQNSGIFFSVFLEAFKRPRRETMWIMSVNGTTNSLAGALAGMLVSHYGARTTMMVGALAFGLPIAILNFVDSLPYAIVCYGFSGIGVSLLLTSIIAASAQYFEKRLYLVMGLVATGAGIGTTLIGNEMEWALAEFGWRTTMLIQAAIILQICVCAALMFNNVEPEEKKSTKEQQNSGSVQAEERTKPGQLQMSMYWFDSRFVLQTFGYVTFTAGRDISQYIMKDLYNSLLLIGAAESFSYSMVITCFGVASTLGRLTSGLMAVVLSPPQANIISSWLCTLGIILLMFAPTMSVFLLLGVSAFGFFSGQQVVYQKQSWGTIFGTDVMAALYGYSYVFTCIPRFSVPPVAGFLKDETGSYTWVVLLAAACMLMSTLSYWAAYVIHKKKSTGIYSVK